MSVIHVKSSNKNCLLREPGFKWSLNIKQSCKTVMDLPFKTQLLLITPARGTMTRVYHLEEKIVGKSELINIFLSRNKCILKQMEITVE